MGHRSLPPQVRIRRGRHPQRSRAASRRVRAFARRVVARGFPERTAFAPGPDTLPARVQSDPSMSAVGRRSRIAPAAMSAAGRDPAWASRPCGSGRAGSASASTRAIRSRSTSRVRCRSGPRNGRRVRTARIGATGHPGRTRACRASCRPGREARSRYGSHHSAARRKSLRAIAACRDASGCRNRTFRVRRFRHRQNAPTASARRSGTCTRDQGDDTSRSRGSRAGALRGFLAGRHLS